MGLNKRFFFKSQISQQTEKSYRILVLRIYSTYLSAFNYLVYQPMSGTVAVAKPGENSKCYADRHGAVKNGLADSDTQTQ